MKQQDVKNLRPSVLPRPERSTRTADCTRDRSRHFEGNYEFERTQESIKKLKIVSENLKARFHELLFGNVNLTTGKDEAKLIQCILAVKQLKQDLCAFTETHRIGKGVIENWPASAGLDGWKLYYSGFDREARAGVGLICSDRVEVEEWEVIEKARIIYVRLTFLGVRMQVFVNYAPTNVKDDEIKADFYTKLDRSVNKYKKKYPNWPVLAVGDFNATIGSDAPFSGSIGRNLDTYKTTNNGLRMIEFCQDHDLFALNTRFESRKSHRITFKLGKTSKRVDYFLADKWLMYNCTNSRAYPHQSHIFESNHYMTMSTFRLPVKKFRKKFFKKHAPKPKILFSALRDDERIRALYGRELDSKLPDIAEFLSGEVSVNSIEKTMIETVKLATAATVPTRTPDREEWMDQDYLNMLKEYKNMKKLKQKRKFSRKIRKKRTFLKNKFFGAMADDINQASVMRQVEEEFRLSKKRSLLKKSTKIKCAPEKLHAKFTEHFKRKPTPNSTKSQIEITDLKKILPDVNILIDLETPDIDEIAYQMEKKLKNGRCCGTDEIVGEQLKYAESEKLPQYVHEIVRRLWEENELPENWSILRLKPIFKNKGSELDPSKYRGMMVGATVSKILIQILLARTHDHYVASILPSQFGFMPNKSTTDAIFIVRQVLMKYPGEIFGCFVDLTAAYDWIPRELMWKVLRMRFGDENEKIVNIFMKIYENTHAKLDGIEELIAIELGLRQGGQESCSLFNYYLDTVLRVTLYRIKCAFEHGQDAGIPHTFKISNECTNRKQRMEFAPNGSGSTIFTNFADDLFVSAKSKEELKIIMQILVQTFTEFGLKMSGPKTKTMSFHTTEDTKNTKTLMTIDQCDLENVHLFKYLGHHLSDNPSDPKYLQQQIGSAYGAWNNYKHVLKDKRINLKTRIKIAESMVRSRLTYAIQTERLNMSQRGKIDGVWCRMLRQMVNGGFARNVNLSPKYSNEKIYEICRTKSASEFCKIQHLKFLAHVARMPNSAVQKQWLFTELPGSRDQWLPLANELNLDPIQLRYTIFDKNRLNELLA